LAIEEPSSLLWRDKGNLESLNIAGMKHAEMKDRQKHVSPQFDK